MAWLLFLLTSALVTSIVHADGVGIIGAGKWMYKPTCAHSCRRVIEECPLLCESGEDTSHHRRHSHAGPPSSECFLKDKAFLRTQALCMTTWCARDNVPISVMEEYWEGHLATGSVGDWSQKPFMSYTEALMLAREDIAGVGEENVPIVVSQEPLNQTSFVSEEDFIPIYNGQKSFEGHEAGHGANSIAIAVSSAEISVIFSLGRFLPGHSGFTSRLNVILSQPLWGHNCRTPAFANTGIMPTRGQGLFIAYIFLVNIFLMIYPHNLLQPNFMSESDHAQLTQMVGDRAGVLAFANFVALFLFSSRNNLLLWVTNWSRSTYLLLHRWVGYACIGQTVLHSILMLYWYDHWADDIVESKLPYWFWGVIATLAICLMLPLAMLPIRQRAYEVFLILHQLFSALTLIGSFLHIWYLYQYLWGYEIWIYIAEGIWFLDRAMRIVRVVCNGKRTATFSAVDASGDYLRVDIEGVVADGHVYLYFPNLSWRVWESHPFSIMASFASSSSPPDESKAVESDPEKGTKSVDITTEKDVPSQNDLSPQTSSNSLHGGPVRPRSTLILRPQSGTTKDIAARTLASGGTVSLPVLIESSYHASPSARELSHCSTLLCIAGGVGITGVLGFAHKFAGPRGRLCWSVRTQALARAVESEIKQLGPQVTVETTVGARLPLGQIIREELGRDDDKGILGISVCGPPGMADEVRGLVGQLAGSRRGVVFKDEAFSW
ncbi:hypothetical protein FQN54_009534 [Arachnomyces sp. PD_36]|nr:hypothetical protein FQN54_009534 [Arachnomyces sp. PD_36]